MIVHTHRQSKAMPPPKLAQAAAQQAERMPLWLLALRAKLQAGPRGLITALKLYAEQPCLPAGLAIAMLYCSVMSFGLLMTGGALSPCCPLIVKAERCDAQRLHTIFSHKVKSVGDCHRLLSAQSPMHSSEPCPCVQCHDASRS